MYDYYDFMDYGIGSSAVSDFLAGIGTVSLIVFIVFAVFRVLWTAAHFVANAVVFMKAGDAPWKALIPVYDMYTYFKLCRNMKLFRVWIIAFAGVCVGCIIMLCSAFYYSSGAHTVSLMGCILAVICMIALIVAYIMLCNNISKVFNKSTGFTFGLVLLPTVFRMILAFGNARYFMYRDEWNVPDNDFDYHEGYIEFLTGDKSGAKLDMKDGETVSIGRDPKLVNFVIGKDTKNSKVSRKHCEIQYAAEQDVFYVTDFSSNGTKLEDGTSLLKGVKTPIRRGTTVILPGNITFIVK